MIRIYKGDEIDIAQIAELKYIAASRYDYSIYNFYYNKIYNLGDLAFLYGTNIEDIVLVFGSSWVLCYSNLQDTITILEWLSIDNSKIKLRQTAEMLKFFKKFFSENKDKLFTAGMRHDSSYKVYSNMKNKGYFTEVYHSLFIDCAEPNEFSMEDCEVIIENFRGNEKLFDEDLLKYIMHDVEFNVTDKLVKVRYQGIWQS